MLLLPALADDAGFGDVVVFADDVDSSAFYAVPQVPRLRTVDGAPALRFVRYRSLDHQGALQAGGFIEAGVELTLTDAQRSQVLTALATRYPGPLSLRTPTYLNGTAQLLIAPVGGALVELVEGSTAPSLAGAMTATFTAALTETGARLLWDEFASDPSVLAVGYELQVMARLPPCTVHAWFDAVAARRTLTADSEAAPGADSDDGAVQKVRREQLQQASAAGVQLDDWPAGDRFAALRDDVREWAWQQIDTAARRLRAAGDLPDDEAAAAFSLDITQTQHTGAAWTLRPQGHLPGIEAQHVERCRLSAELEKPLFDTREVWVLPNVDFERDGIAAVEVTMSTDDTRSTFVLDKPTDGWFFRYVAKGDGAYRCRHRVVFRASATALELPEHTSADTVHVVGVSDAGRVRLHLDASPVDWRGVSSVTATIAYCDPASGIEARTDALSFGPGHLTDDYCREVLRLVTQPVPVTVVYRLADGRTTERTFTAANDTSVVILDPFERPLVLHIDAPGGFTSQRAVIVEVEAAGATRTATLREGDDRQVLRFDLLPGEADSFRWRQTITFADGHHEAGEWRDGRGPGRLLAGLLPAAELVIEPATDLVDWSRTKLVTLTVRHPATGEAQLTEARAITAQAPPAAIRIPLADAADRAYGYEATFFLTDGSSRTVGPLTTTDHHLVLQPPNT
ncbi:MAG: hypothetical protein Q7V88_15450 [Actinomycetota bacterium]|nr:hypothetical protein [Actinomycetota bacterium]